MLRKIGILLLAVIVVAWGILYLASYGVLVAEEKVQLPVGQAYLKCRYFTGVGMANQQFWYSENAIVGRAICPRLYSFAG
jgi:hypothetical protein